MKKAEKENSKHQIRVLHLIQGLEVGGLEYMVVNLLNGLDMRRYQSSVCCYDTLGPLVKSLNGEVEIHHLKRKQGVDYTYSFKLAIFLKRKKIQILHLHNSTAFFYGVIAGKIARVPVIVYTEHARDVFPDIKIRIADKFLSLFTDKVIVVAGYLKKNLIKYEWFNPLKMTTIYNGIDETKFNFESHPTEIREGLGLPENRKIIGIVARLDPIKNHKCLIKAMQLVIKKFSDSLLLIVGDGSQREELEGLTKNIGLERNVIFLGTRQDVPQLLSIMDIFILSSKSEGLPITLLEAMAASKPIIATNVGGIPEVIENGINGILIPPDNSEAMAEAVLELLKDEEKSKKLGMMARKRFENNFTLPMMVRKYEELYESFLS